MIQNIFVRVYNLHANVWSIGDNRVELLETSDLDVHTGVSVLTEYTRREIISSVWY